jgi:hypothetical protein
VRVHHVITISLKVPSPSQDHDGRPANPVSSASRKPLEAQVAQESPWTRPLFAKISLDVLTRRIGSSTQRACRATPPTRTTRSLSRFTR